MADLVSAAKQQSGRETQGKLFGSPYLAWLVAFTWELQFHKNVSAASKTKTRPLAWKSMLTAPFYKAWKNCTKCKACNLIAGRKTKISHLFMGKKCLIHIRRWCEWIFWWFLWLRHSWSTLLGISSTSSEAGSHRTTIGQGNATKAFV